MLVLLKSVFIGIYDDYGVPIREGNRVEFIYNGSRFEGVIRYYTEEECFGIDTFHGYFKLTNDIQNLKVISD